MPVVPHLCARCGAYERTLWAHHPAVVADNTVELLCEACEQRRRSIEAFPPQPETRLAVAIAQSYALFGEGI